MTTNFNRARTGLSNGLLPSFLTLLVCLGVAACADRDTNSSASARTESLPAVADERLPEVLATIGDDQITLDDVRGRVGGQLDQMTNSYLQQRHTLLDEALQQIVRDRLLAAEAEKRGMSTSELVEEETGASLEVTDAEIEAWYEENQSRLQGRSLDQVRDQIADHLRTTRRNEALTGLEERLSEEYGVAYHIEPFRLELDSGDAPSLGPSDAAVTLVEFSDFECPLLQPLLSYARADQGQLRRPNPDRLPAIPAHEPSPERLQSSGSLAVCERAGRVLGFP